MSKHRKPPKCPICKTGKLIEDIPGAHCSRNYANRRPCRFKCGMYSTPEEYKKYVEWWKKNDAIEQVRDRIFACEVTVVRAAKAWLNNNLQVPLIRSVRRLEGLEEELAKLAS